MGVLTVDKATTDRQNLSLLKTFLGFGESLEVANSAAVFQSGNMSAIMRLVVVEQLTKADVV